MVAIGAPISARDDVVVWTVVVVDDDDAAVVRVVVLQKMRDSLRVTFSR